MKAVIYARVSSERQDVDLSISAQLKALREYAERNDHYVVTEFVDEAESGKTTDRPAFRDMVAQARRSAKPFDIILVWKYSRFVRNREDSIIFKTMLRKAGVQVRSLSVSRLSVTSVELESVNHCLERLYDALETEKIQLADLAPRIQQLRQRQEQLQATRWGLEQQLSDKRVELADVETVACCISDLRNLLNESSLSERKSFVRSFVKEVKVTGDEVLLTYTMPMLPKGITEEKLPVLSIVHDGGPSDSIAQPKIKTFFELSLIPADYSTINNNS